MSHQKRALIHLTPDQLEQLLDLPDGYEVLYVGGDTLRSSVVIVVSSDDLAPVPPGSEPPALAGLFSTRQAIVDGELYVRWGWSPEVPT